MKAYIVFVSDMDCIVFAATGAKARWRARKGATEAGYKAPFNTVKSRRRPDFDYLYEPKFDGGCYSLEYLLSANRL